MELERKGIKYNPLKQINKRANLTACLWNSKLEHALSTKIFRWCKRRHCKEACLCCVKLPRLQSLLKHDEKFFSIKMETRDKSKQGCVGLGFVMMIYLKGMMCAVMLLGYMDVDKQSRTSRKREKSPIKYIGRKVKFCKVVKEWWAQQHHEFLVSTFRGKKVPRVRASVRSQEEIKSYKYKRKKGSEVLCEYAIVFNAKVVAVGMEGKDRSERQKNTKEERSDSCLWDHKIWLLKVTQQRKKKKIIKARLFAAVTRRTPVLRFKYMGHEKSLSLVTMELPELVIGKKDHKAKCNMRYSSEKRVELFFELLSSTGQKNTKRGYQEKMDKPLSLVLNNAYEMIGKQKLETWSKEVSWKEVTRKRLEDWKVFVVSTLRTRLISKGAVMIRMRG
ncbi:hypothetical protein Bca101_048092 [Brassica carinata]